MPLFSSNTSQPKDHEHESVGILPPTDYHSQYYCTPNTISGSQRSSIGSDLSDVLRAVCTDSHEKISLAALEKNYEEVGPLDGGKRRGVLLRREGSERGGIA